jgi:hypothetical protein
VALLGIEGGDLAAGVLPSCWRIVDRKYRLALRVAATKSASRSLRTYTVNIKYYIIASDDHTGLLRRPARCSVITQRARMQQRPSSVTASVSACAASCFVARGSSPSSARERASREEKNALPHPGREPRGCLHAGGEQRGHLAAPGRANKAGRMSRRASRIALMP